MRHRQQAARVPLQIARWAAEAAAAEVRLLQQAQQALRVAPAVKVAAAEAAVAQE